MLTKIGKYITLVFPFNGFYLNDSFSKKHLDFLNPKLLAKVLKTDTSACFHFGYSFILKIYMCLYFESNGVPK